MKKHWKKFAFFLCISICLELIVFNHRALFSLFADEQHLEFTREGNVVSVSGMSGDPGYVYVGVESYTDDGEAMPLSITIEIQDEGNFEYYELSELRLYTLMEKSKYLAIHSYGEIKGMRIRLNEEVYGMPIWLTDVIYDAKVPWFVSLPRILLVFVLMCLVWYLWYLYNIEEYVWEKRTKGVAIALLLLINMGIFFFAVTSNPVYINPLLPYHYQYHQLAVALSQGKVSIEAGNEVTREALLGLENPYDFNLRMQMVPEAGNVWDISYYQGQFYVYFGIVPVLLFYLPYYLLFHGAFPTWIGVFLMGCGVLGGTYYLLGTIRRRWFPEGNYVWYLLLSVIMGNGLNLYCALFHADFYYLPIVMALCFSLWGLGLIVSAADKWDRREKGYVIPKLAGGALCLALTAGCRPQFLVGSFLIIPILLPVLLGEKNILQQVRRRNGKRLLAIVLPYVIVAAGLMYYNFVRYGSVFDFGANYNLTNNDMTHRGFQWGRLPDGIFMYLFQPFNLRLGFPLAESVPFNSSYLGNTINEAMFGGVFWTHGILLSLAVLSGIRKELRQKRLFGLTILCVAMALLVVMADTEMAGILNRYTTDFLWLLMIPTMIVLFQLLEQWQGTQKGRWLFAFILAVGIFEIVYELGTGIQNGDLIHNNAHRYYMLRNFFW